MRIQLIPILLTPYLYKAGNVLLNNKGPYRSYKGLLIVDFKVRFVFLDLRVLRIVRARSREIILFNRGINRGRRARMRRFRLFKALFRPYRPFFSLLRLFRRQFLVFRRFTLSLLLHIIFRPKLSPNDLRIKKEAYLVLYNH
jgi:hypothetical protein